MVTLLLLELLGAPGADEASPQTLSAFSVDLPVEAAATGASLALAVVVDVMLKPTLEGGASCQQPGSNGRCNPADLSGFDRYAVGKTSRPWTLFSDVALYSSIAIPTLYLGLESLVLPTDSPWGDFAKDLLVVSEAMTVAAMFQTFFKFVFRRPRPGLYQDPTGSRSFDQELSFPSGHTSVVAAATTALTTTIFFRHPDSIVRYVVLGAGVLLTGLTGFARVESGHHFPSDVLTGMLVGGLAGFLIPWLHQASAKVTPTAAFDPASGASMLGVAGKF